MKVAVNFAATTRGQVIIFFTLFAVFIYYIIALSVAVDLANAVGNESISKQNATRVAGALGLEMGVFGLGLSIAGIAVAFMPAPELQVHKAGGEKSE